MVFLQYRGQSFLHRMNPSLKLVAIFLASFTLLAVFDPWTPLLLYLAGLLVLVGLGRVPLRLVAIGHIPFVTFAFSVLWVNLLFRTGGPVALAWGPIAITQEGLSLGFSLALRTLVIGVYSLIFVLTTDPSRLVVSLVQNLRISQRFAYGILAAYRFLPTLQTEFATIRHAHRVRAATLRRQRRAGPWATVRRYALPLLVSAIRRGERTAIALESRGLGAYPKRTYWRPEPVGPGDWLFLVGAVVVSLGVPLLMAWLGLFRGFEAITVF